MLKPKAERVMDVVRFITARSPSLSMGKGGISATKSAVSSGSCALMVRGGALIGQRRTRSAIAPMPAAGVTTPRKK
jgi:hypothetical protein